MAKVSPSAPTLLCCQRHLFDLPDDVAYLNCAYLSPLPKASMAAGEQGLWRKARPWEVVASDFFTTSQAVRERFAELIHGQSEDVALVPSASYGLAQAAHNLPLGRGHAMVTLAEQFPSNVYPWMDLAERSGARLVTVPRPSDDDWTRAVLETLDQLHWTSRLALVAVPHCHWTDGGLLDLVAIGSACRAVGAQLVVDATQSLGALPLDVAAVDPDWLVASGYKWLLGPYSYGYLYVAKRHQQGRPIEANWIARKGSENFAGLVHYQRDYQAGARRFDVGEHSNFALAPAAQASLELLLGWGIGNIQATLAVRTAAMAERARAELGLASLPAHRRAGHFLGLRLGGAVPQELPAQLARAKVHVSVRGTVVRITPHLYTTDEDVDRLFAVLGQVLGR